MSSQTYEQNAANTSLAQSPDPIHWNPNYSYRNSPYRHLHHQEKDHHGAIGNFTIRLVEATNLQRSHWSLLGMGLVKHLGLSNAHGEVSSFAVMKLGFRFRDSYSNFNARSTNSSTLHNDNGNENDDMDRGDWKNGTVASSSATSTSASMLPNQNNNNNLNNIIYTNNNQTYQSTTIPFESSPKWPSTQTESNTSTFTIPLKKGAMPQDGMRIILSVELREETTAVDSMVPIGNGGGGNGSVLGVGEIDLTGLVLRNNDERIGSGGSGGERKEGDQSNDFVDVFDEWIDLSNLNSSPASHHANNVSKSKSSTSSHNADSGKVRLIISYEPCGMTPQKGDIIAFESFARRPGILSKCPIIVPPLHPLQIKDMKGEYILASYDMVHRNNTNCAPGSASALEQQQQHHQQLQQQRYNDDMMAAAFMENQNINSHSHGNKQLYNDTKKREEKKIKRGTVRIHRNTIFVIERTNLLDTAVNLSLKPTDIIMSTTVGKNVSHAAQPYVEAAGDLLAPVLLSSRLLFEASKVGGGALAVGVKCAVVNVVEKSDPEKRRKAKRSSLYDD